MTQVAEIPKSFEDKLKARLKDSIGELISDEDLTALVNKSLQSVFFDRRPNPKYTGYSSSEEPATLAPLLHEITKELLTPLMKEKIDIYIKENPQLIVDTVKAVVENGAGAAMIATLNNQFNGIFYNMLQNAQQQFKVPNS